MRRYRRGLRLRRDVELVPWERRLRVPLSVFGAALRLHLVEQSTQLLVVDLATGWLLRVRGRDRGGGHPEDGGGDARPPAGRCSGRDTRHARAR
jgi:hypothetical protein